MASKRQRRSESVSRGESLSDHASDWIQRFSRQLERDFADAGRSLPADAPVSDYQYATIRAMRQALLATGMAPESFAEAVGQVLMEERPGATNLERGSRDWPIFNRRRVFLIEKRVAGDISPRELVELERLQAEADRHMSETAPRPLEALWDLKRQLTSE